MWILTVILDCQILNLLGGLSQRMKPTQHVFLQVLMRGHYNLQRPSQPLAAKSSVGREDFCGQSSFLGINFDHGSRPP